MRPFVLALLLSSATFAQAAEPVSNEALRALMLADQAARAPAVGIIDWAKVTEDDKARRMAVLELLQAGKVQTADDYFNAALVFQHGQEADDIRLAFSLSSIAHKLAPGNKDASWLTAASWDRILMQMNQPQWYGTQFSKAHAPGSKWELYKIDEKAVTDDERRALNVRTLDEAKQKAKALNQE
jgi:hypothetical protein